VEALQALSRQVITQLELRRKLADAARITSELQQVEQERSNFLLASRQHEKRNSSKPNTEAAVENLRLARAVNSASDGVVITDPNSTDNPIIYTNPFL